jgi:hypothetical protein
MSAPQMKEGPASSMLRAMFAGFGSLMSVMDRVRNKPPAEAPADAEAPAAAATPAPEATAAAEDTAAPETVAPETVAPETVEPETVALQTVAPETVVAESSAASEASAGPETVAAPEAAATAEPETSAAPQASAGTETPAATEPSGALPLANYDELSVASLRARLRNLTNDDLTQLMAYEKAHQDRPEVIKMFQNRLVKMTTGLPKLVE